MLSGLGSSLMSSVKAYSGVTVNKDATEEEPKIEVVTAATEEEKKEGVEGAAK